MKICVISDIHGSSAWKEFVHREMQQVDRFVFLGDYFDSKDSLPDARKKRATFGRLYTSPKSIKP